MREYWKAGHFNWFRLSSEIFKTWKLEQITEGKGLKLKLASFLENPAYD